MKKFIVMGAIGMAAMMTIVSVNSAQGKPADSDRPVPGASAANEMVKIPGRVVDSSGNPVAGAITGLSHEVVEGKFNNPVKDFRPTGEDGKFSINLPRQTVASTGSMIVACSADGKHAGKTIIKRSANMDSITEITVMLERTTKVTATLEASDDSVPFSRAHGVATLITADGEYAIQSSRTEGDKIVFFLPNGEYEIRILSQASTAASYKSEYKKITLDGSREEQDLGMIKLAPSPMHHGLGREAPDLDVTHTRGTDADSIDDFEGKWLLINFWGVWSEPSLAAMPKIMTVYEKNQDIKEQFEIISIHNKSAWATDLTVLDQSINDRRIVETRWDNKKIAWPMMIDGKGETMREWGITTFPSMAIIDPEGNLYAYGENQLGNFEEILASLRVNGDKTNKSKRAVAAKAIRDAADATREAAKEAAIAFKKAAKAAKEAADKAIEDRK